ncbi:hypothetical protein ABIF68_008598 [Bradyrhizobium japonicum]
MAFIWSRGSDCRPARALLLLERRDHAPPEILLNPNFALEIGVADDVSEVDDWGAMAESG